MSGDGYQDDTENLGETRSSSPRAAPTVPRPEIGPYRLLERIGEGGMGEVWLADQQHPVRRRVALKVIKAGMDTRQVVARFEAERQALAMMDHPAIARIYEAGTTPKGRPYFAMEYVPGVPLTEHCDRNKLSTRDRLELFVRICEGVQHAHQKAVIHRDLKPSNVLVSLNEGQASPKIIDFGVAKATAQSLTDRTMHTQIGTPIGTPAYMSPEQAELTGQDIDTRTDVYSLGVMLYELLVGGRPFEALGQVSPRDELLRRIREDEPQRPSVRLSTLGEHSGLVAAQRRTQLQQLKTELLGDLDWITMKALEKDRSRRYGSPNELAEDIRRFLTDQPIAARPPSAGYRMQKFLRRHRTGAALSALSLLVLIGFALVMAMLAGRIAHERDRANREAAASRRVAEFLGNMLGSVDQNQMGLALDRALRERAARAADPANPSSPEGLDRVAKLETSLAGVNLTDAALHLLDEQVLAQAAATIETRLGDDPAIAGQLHLTLANAYARLGPYDRVLTQALQAIAIITPVQGEGDPGVFSAMNLLGLSHTRLGRFEPAIQVYRDMLAIHERTGNTDRARLHTMRNDLGDTLRYAGRYGDAEPMLTQALDLAREIHGDRHEETLATMNNLALVYSAQGRRGEAAALLGEAYRLARQERGDEDQTVMILAANLAGELAGSRRYDEALRLFASTNALERRLFGDEFYDTLVTAREFGLAYLSAGRPGEAAEILQPLVTRMERVMGPGHSSTLGAGRYLAQAEQALGRTAEAAARFRRLVATCRLARPDSGGLLAQLLLAQAHLANATGRHAEAEAGAREALQVLRELFGETFWRVSAAKVVVGEALVGQRQFDAGETLLQEGYAALLEAAGEDSADAAGAAVARVAVLYDRLGRNDRSAEWRRRSPLRE